MGSGTWRAMVHGASELDTNGNHTGTNSRRCTKIWVQPWVQGGKSLGRECLPTPEYPCLGKFLEQEEPARLQRHEAAKLVD